jgi:hypothetical protein
MTAPTQTIEAALLDRVDRLTLLLELALAPQLDARRSELRADPVDAAILDAATADWQPASRLQAAVAKATGKKKRAIQEHISDLLDRGVLRSQGGGPTTEYRSSGVI